MSKSFASSERRAPAQQVQVDHRRAERRRTILLLGAAVTVAVLIGGWAVFELVQEQQRRNAAETAAKKPIAGVQTFKGLSRNQATHSLEHGAVWIG